jgi:hypothetical protein
VIARLNTEQIAHTASADVRSQRRIPTGLWRMGAMLPYQHRVGNGLDEGLNSSSQPGHPHRRLQPTRAATRRHLTAPKGQHGEMPATSRATVPPFGAERRLNAWEIKGFVGRAHGANTRHKLCSRSSVAAKVRRVTEQL